MTTNQDKLAEVFEALEGAGYWLHFFADGTVGNDIYESICSALKHKAALMDAVKEEE